LYDDARIHEHQMAVITISLILQLVLVYIFSPMEQQPLVGQGFLIIGALRSHSDTPHSIRLLWTGDQPDVETSTLQNTKETDIQALGKFPTHNPRKRVAENQSLRPRGHWDRLLV